VKEKFCKQDQRGNDTVELLLTLLFAIVGGVLMGMSFRQPFPEISQRFGVYSIIIALLLLVARNAPNALSTNSILILMTAFGGVGVISGVRNMAVTQKDVIVAPFAGALMSIGATGLLVEEWANFTSNFEQIGSFVLICLLGMLEVYLVFRGLLIGKLSRSWSQAGLRQLQRGLLEGDKGAIACFEKAWDVENEHMNPMTYLALERIHAHLENTSEAENWREKLLEFGGEAAVAEEWISAIEAALKAL
jgi:hypothetical protein